uniref:Ac18 n=1 Tax=Lymantria dispar multicapsid nuclear polyhedrosis virus TaxID=10449 RepID=A0A1B1MR28_NPVLD|nr:hypothetical protein [Lymantria dispar multiple nucleopolyhedrovirus]
MQNNHFLRRQQQQQQQIPYHSKREINDKLCVRVLGALPPQFYRECLRSLDDRLKNEVWLAGGSTAAAIHLDANTFKPNAGLDLEMYVSEDRFGKMDSNNDGAFNSQLDLVQVHQDLESLVEKHTDRVNALLERVDTAASFVPHFSGGGGPIVVFKSYKREAIEFDPNNVTFVVNRRLPMKRTFSRIDENSLLLRFSFNVHMTRIDDDAASPPIVWHRFENETRTLTFFPWDLYFLNVMIIRKTDSELPFTLCQRSIFDNTTRILVKSLQYAICDKMESLLVGCVRHKVCRTPAPHAIAAELKSLYNTWQQRAGFFDMKQCKDFFDLQTRQERYSIRDIRRSVLYTLGPDLGVVLIVWLIRNKRFRDRRHDITHEINIQVEESFDCDSSHAYRDGLMLFVKYVMHH